MPGPCLPSMEEVVTATNVVGFEKPFGLPSRGREEGHLRKRMSYRLVCPPTGRVFVRPDQKSYLKVCPPEDGRTPRLSGSTRIRDAARRVKSNRSPRIGVST